MIETEAKQTKSTRIQQRKYQEAESEKCLLKKKRSTSITIIFLIHNNWHLPQIRESKRYNYWPQMIPRYSVSG